MASKGNRISDASQGMDTPHYDELRENISEATDSLREAASNAVPAAREQIDRARRNVAAQAESWEECLTAQVREQPMSSLLVAAAIGMFAGAFFLRR